MTCKQVKLSTTETIIGTKKVIVVQPRRRKVEECVKIPPTQNIQPPAVRLFLLTTANIIFPLQVGKSTTSKVGSQPSPARPSETPHQSGQGQIKYRTIRSASRITLTSCRNVPADPPEASPSSSISPLNNNLVQKNVPISTCKLKTAPAKARPLRTATLSRPA